MLVVFDIDGTLADNHHRVHHVKSKPKNWPAYDAAIPDDTAIWPMAETFRALRLAGYDIIFVTGRSERSRKDTVEWLDENDLHNLDENDLHNSLSKVYMRPDGDYRSDDIVKCEILDQIIKEYGFKPDIWFDDRPRVVRAIRARGVFVVDVYQGEEEF
jgi:phosphoglycolate phosphatase-like HAD superfamily hydrolase